MKTIGRLIFTSCFSLLLASSMSVAQERVKSKTTHKIRTNAVEMPKAPVWLKRTRVEKVTSRIQTQLEWTIRKVKVVWYDSEDSFQAFHKKGPTVLAIARKSENSIHIGPRVTDANFDSVFGHELVHVIIYQKYKAAIPKWLEEGLANLLAKQGKVEYKWLARKPFPDDVTNLGHPFSGTSDRVHIHYNTSHALAEMIAAKCNLNTLLQLSVERKLENYLLTYCEIKDLNGAYRSWVQKKAKQQ